MDIATNGLAEKFYIDDHAVFFACIAERAIKAFGMLFGNEYR